MNMLSMLRRFSLLLALVGCAAPTDDEDVSEGAGAATASGESVLEKTLDKAAATALATKILGTWSGTSTVFGHALNMSAHDVPGAIKIAPQNDGRYRVSVYSNDSDYAEELLQFPDVQLTRMFIPPTGGTRRYWIPLEPANAERVTDESLFRSCYLTITPQEGATKLFAYCSKRAGHRMNSGDFIVADKAG